jgi:PAS domain-containing protein
MDMTEFFKGIVDTEEGPIVICDLDYKIIYINPTAEAHYKRGSEMVGKHLELFLDEEMMSKVCMTLEWFKEDEKNNHVFALHDNAHNWDMYMLAIRNSGKKLIGFYGRLEKRTPDTSKEFDID